MKENESISPDELGLEEFRREKFDSKMFESESETNRHLQWIQAHPYQYLAWIKENFPDGVKGFEETIIASTKERFSEPENEQRVA